MARTRFEMKVCRPDAEDWCRVEITIDFPTRRWSTADSCLQGTEVNWLINWLESAANDNQPPERIHFLEPELSFELREDGGRWLRIYLQYSVRPIWVKIHPDEEFFVEFPVTPDSLRRAAASLREQLKWGRRGRPT
jgi:hypothetical protein